MHEHKKPAFESSGIDTPTRQVIRCLTDNVCASSSELDNLLYRNMEKCWRAMRTADFVDASMGLVPNTALAPFYEVISQSCRVLDEASRLIADLRKNSRKLCAVLYRIDSTQEKGHEDENN